MPPVLTLPVRDVRVETPRTRVVHLALDDVAPAPPGGSALPGHARPPSGGRDNRFEFRAGQAVRLGLHGQPESKPYSIASSPEQAVEMGALEFLVQVGEDGSAGTHLGVPSAGVRIDVEGPMGAFRFPDDPPEQRFLFVAGGTGIAPLRAMLWHAVAAYPGRQFALVYSARSAEEFAYGEELQRLARAGRLELLQTVTRGGEAGWSGGRGRITHAQIASLMTTLPTLYLVCGPPPLVDDVTTWLTALGVPKKRILAEGWG